MTTTTFVVIMVLCGAVIMGAFLTGISIGRGR